MYTFSFTNDWLFSDDELKCSPSSRRGISWDHEVELRKNGIIFYERLAKNFRIPRLADSTGKQLFHRFFTRESFTDHDKYLVAATCLFLGAKAEDHPLSIQTFSEQYIVQRRNETVEFALRYHTVESIAESILAKEYVVLHALAFDLDVSFPHLLLNDKIESLLQLYHGLSSIEKAALSNTLLKTSWSFLNDCSRTPLCLRLSAEDIADGAVYLAGTINDTIPNTVVTPDGQSWEYALRDNQNVLIDAARFILEAYVCPDFDESKLSPSIVQLLNMYHPDRGMESTENVNDDDTATPISFSSENDFDNTTDLDSDGVSVMTPENKFDDNYPDVHVVSKKRMFETSSVPVFPLSPSFVAPYYSPPFSCDGIVESIPALKRQKI
jgi:hypothetical protein